MTFNEYRGHFLTRYEAAQVSHCAPKTLVEHPDVVSVGGFVPGEELYPALQFDRDGQPHAGTRDPCQASECTAGRRGDRIVLHPSAQGARRQEPDRLAA